MLFVEGEAGIGKTRLVDEFTERLARRGEQFHLLVASYPPGGAATASGAFSTAYREFLGGEGIDERLKDCLVHATGLIPAFAALLVGGPPPAGVAPLSRDAILHAFTLVTQALAAEQPTIVVIEDLHFAPELGRAIFAALAIELAHHRIFLIGTTRPGLSEEWLREVGRLEQTSRLEPPRLTPKELSRLLIDLFRSEKLAGELGWAIATKSDGNPFFVFELVRALREEHLIAREPDGTWVKTGLIKDLNVPSSVLDLVEARIRDLDEIDKDLLEVASCCGFEFDPLLVAAALDMEQIPAMKRFAFLENKHRLVRAVGRQYVFDHHQVQEALYRGLPELLREPYHAKLGVALEQRAGREADGAVAVDICEHFLAGGVGERAKPYLEAALLHLRDGYLHDEAIELAQRALAKEGLIEGAERVEALLRTAASLEMRGRHQEDREVLDEALGIADATGDKRLMSKVRTFLGRLCIWTSKYDAARDWLIEARRMATEAGDEEAGRQATGNLGIVYYRLRDYDEAYRLFVQVCNEARDRGDKRALAIGMLNVGNVHWIRGEAEEALAHYEGYRDLSREIGYREGEALAAGNIGNILFAQGRLEDARAHYEEVLRLSAAIGDRHKTALFEGSIAQVDVTLGRPERAREHYDRSLAITGVIGMPREEATSLAGLADVAAETGDEKGAAGLLEQALALFDRIGDIDGAAIARMSAARIARAAGNQDEAIRHLEFALESGRASGDNPQELPLLAARACLPGGDIAHAEQRFKEQRKRLGRSSVLTEMHTAYLLYQATGKSEYLERARELLDVLRKHAPEKDREAMVDNNRTHRAILAEG